MIEYLNAIELLNYGLSASQWQGVIKLTVIGISCSLLLNSLKSNNDERTAL
ncbi:MAG: hypothetical protein ACPG8A_11775 [Psychrobium sp.]